MSQTSFYPIIFRVWVLSIWIGMLANSIVMMFGKGPIAFWKLISQQEPEQSNELQNFENQVTFDSFESESDTGILQMNPSSSTKSDDSGPIFSNLLISHNHQAYYPDAQLQTLIQPLNFFDYFIFLFITISLGCYEGYKAFQLSFSPTLVIRSWELSEMKTSASIGFLENIVELIRNLLLSMTSSPNYPGQVVRFNRFRNTWLGEPTQNDITNNNNINQIQLSQSQQILRFLFGSIDLIIVGPLAASGMVLATKWRCIKSWAIVLLIVVLIILLVLLKKYTDYLGRQSSDSDHLDHDGDIALRTHLLAFHASIDTGVLVGLSWGTIAMMRWIYILGLASNSNWRSRTRPVWLKGGEYPENIKEDLEKLNDSEE